MTCILKIQQQQKNYLFIPQCSKSVTNFALDRAPTISETAIHAKVRIGSRLRATVCPAT